MINPKQKAAETAASYISEGMVVGVGTGSTAYYFILALADLQKKGMRFRTVPTSKITEELLHQNKLLVAKPNDIDMIDITVDGADEIDRNLQLIKGGGGALLQEKMVAFITKRYIVIADDSKCVDKLGKFPLPIEVIPFGYKAVKIVLENSFGIEVNLRMGNGHPFVTDHHHYLLDCHFHEINDAPALHSHLNNIPGVVDNGLFLNMADTAIIGQPDGKIMTIQA